MEEEQCCGKELMKLVESESGAVKWVDLDA